MTRNALASTAIVIGALLIALVGLSGPGSAETVIHGYSVPTAEHQEVPQVQVCTPTGSWWDSGTRHLGSQSSARVGSYGAAVCLPEAEGTPRLSRLSVPVKVAKAIELIETTVNFDHDSATLSGGAVEAVSDVALWLKETPVAGLRISGYTDATGSEEYNQDLSRRRVEAVAELLVFHEVPEDQLQLEWFGETRLLVNTQKRERANRRVEIIPILLSK